MRPNHPAVLLPVLLLFPVGAYAADPGRPRQVAGSTAGEPSDAQQAGAVLTCRYESTGMTLSIDGGQPRDLYASMRGLIELLNERNRVTNELRLKALPYLQLPADRMRQCAEVMDLLRASVGTGEVELALANLTAVSERMASRASSGAAMEPLSLEVPLRIDRSRINVPCAYEVWLDLLVALRDGSREEALGRWTGQVEAFKSRISRLSPLVPVPLIVEDVDRIRTMVEAGGIEQAESEARLVCSRIVALILDPSRPPAPLDLGVVEATPAAVPMRMSLDEVDQWLQRESARLGRLPPPTTKSLGRKASALELKWIADVRASLLRRITSERQAIEMARASAREHHKTAERWRQVGDADKEKEFLDRERVALLNASKTPWLPEQLPLSVPLLLYDGGVGHIDWIERAEFESSKCAERLKELESRFMKAIVAMEGYLDSAVGKQSPGNAADQIELMKAQLRTVRLLLEHAEAGDYPAAERRMREVWRECVGSADEDPSRR